MLLKVDIPVLCDSNGNELPQDILLLNLKEGDSLEEVRSRLASFMRTNQVLLRRLCEPDGYYFDDEIETCSRILDLQEYSLEEQKRYLELMNAYDHGESEEEDLDLDDIIARYEKMITLTQLSLFSRQILRYPKEKIDVLVGAYNGTLSEELSLTKAILLDDQVYQKIVQEKNSYIDRNKRMLAPIPFSKRLKVKLAKEEMEKSMMEILNTKQIN